MAAWSLTRWAISISCLGIYPSFTRPHMIQTWEQLRQQGRCRANAEWRRPAEDTARRGYLVPDLVGTLPMWEHRARPDSRRAKWCIPERGGRRAVRCGSLVPDPCRACGFVALEVSAAGCRVQPYCGWIVQPGALCAVRCRCPMIARPEIHYNIWQTGCRAVHHSGERARGRAGGRDIGAAAALN